LFVDASGNVGVGASPTYPLDVNGAIATRRQGNVNDLGYKVDSGSWVQPNLIGHYYTGSTDATSVRVPSSSTSTSASLYLDNNGVFQVIGTGSATRLTIDSSGRLGLGTSSPSYKLDVSGAAASAIVGAQVVNTDPSGYSNLILRNSGGTAKEYQLVVGGSSSASASNFWLYDATAGQVRLHVSSVGNVGIGTTSPGYPLDVKGIVNVVDGSNGRINLGATTNYLYGDSAGNLIVGNSGGDRVQIDASGRLLVGTSSTSATFTTALLQGSAGDAAAQSILRLARGASTPLSGNALGVIAFSNSAHSNGAEIYAARDGGTWSASSLPTALVFSTTANGESSPTTRTLIASNGDTVLNNLSSFYPNTDNAVNLGLDIRRWTAVYAVNGTIQTSDKREKIEVKDSLLGVNFIKSLRPVSYKWIEGGKRDTGERDEDNNYIYESVPGQRTHWGFIAQEVKEAVDAAGVDFGGWVLTDKDDPDSQQALRYDQFIAPLTKALQEALAEIDVLKAKVAVLEAQ
jgi:hypothetical protein